MNCYCNDDTKMKSYDCVICQEPKILLMSRPQREWDCCKKITMICGMSEYVCDACETLGWYSTAGWGGGTYHKNDITGENKTPK